MNGEPGWVSDVVVKVASVVTSDSVPGIDSLVVTFALSPSCPGTSPAFNSPFFFFAKI